MDRFDGDLEKALAAAGARYTGRSGAVKLTIELNRYPVHRAMTQPQIFVGATCYYSISNFALTTKLFAAVVLHVAGYSAYFREPQVSDLWIIRVSKWPHVPN